MIVTDDQDHVLPIDIDVAAIWADLHVPHYANTLDKLIAATALLYSLQVVTRDTQDFEKSGVRTVNPFTD